MNIKLLKCLAVVISFTISKNIWLSDSYANSYGKHDHHSSKKHDHDKDSKKTDSTNQELNVNKIDDNEDVKKFNKNLKNYNHELVFISNDSKKLHKFKIAIADDFKKRERGLMEIKKLPEDHAMLFTFEESQIVNFWMKDTLIPLDIIFVDKSNKILSIAKNNKPLDEKIISSEFEVNKTLEVNAGIVDKYNIKVGDKISFK